MALIDLECPAKLLKSTPTDVSSQRCRLRSTLVVEIKQIVCMYVNLYLNHQLRLS